MTHNSSSKANTVKAPTTAGRTGGGPRQLPAYALAILDILLIGLCLVIFALFDHVIPRGEVAAVYTVPDVTAAPIAPETDTAVAANAAEAQPTAAEGDFSAKVADKFTDGEVIVTDTSYQSANLNVTLKKIERVDNGTDNQTIFVQDIYIRNIDCLRTVFAKDTYGKSISEDVVSMSTRSNAVAAINGDYYGVGTGGICIRNGVLYRRVFEENEEVAIIYRNGDLKVFMGESDLDVDREMAAGAWQSFSFGPGLLDEKGNLRLDGYQRVNHDPRTLIGMVEPGHYMFVVIDGRQTGYAVGLTYKECADLCWELGMKAAYNLDGGQTSQMTFMGQLVNRPYKNGRSTSDMVIIADWGT